MTDTIYPELTATEVDEIIEPLAGLRLDLPTSTVLAHVPPALLARHDFGEGAETYSFQRLCEHVSAHVWESCWDPALDADVADLPAFREAVRVVLVRDFFELAVRPLAGLLTPREDTDSRTLYQEYCRRMLATSFAELAESHPLTWARAGLRLERRMAALAETVRRVTSDTDAIGRVLGVTTGRISAVSLAGDTHAGGRSVSIITFDSGDRVVYKPRPVDAEAGYATLVDRWNAATGSDLLAARVLPRADHGYVEYVEPTPGATLDLRRVGELACLLYGLNARDMHFENILATSRGAVPVDLETLLHPQRHKARGLVETAASAYRKMDTSVFAMGVLPMVMTRPDRDGYVDVGFVGGGEARGSGPFRRLAVEHPFTAEVRVRWHREDSTGPARRQELPADAQLRTRKAITEMVAGFTHQYGLLLEHRDRFRQLVTDCFGTARLRYVHNATVQYEQCLRTLTGDAAGADGRLSAALVKRIAIASRGADHRLVASECEQMWATDVPYFLVRADRAYLTSAGVDAPLAELTASPLEQVRAKLDRLGPADLSEQVALIRIALSAKLPDPHGTERPERLFQAVPVTGRRSTPGLRDLAAELAASLAAEQVQDRYPHLPYTWIGPVASSDSARPWPPGVLGYDLYTGRSGPALALLAAGLVLEEEEWAAAGRRVFDPVARILASDSYEARSLAAAGVGAYNGFAGTTWALWQAGRLLGDASMTAAASTAHGLITRTDVDDQWFDVVAGGVGSCLVLGATSPGSDTGGGTGGDAEAADAVAYALRTDLPERMLGSGMAHGLSGLLFFGARAARTTGSRPAGELVRRAHAALLSGFADEGFPLRTNRRGARNHSDSWCNGTAGTLVALAEAVAADLLPTAALDGLVTGLRHGQVSTSLTLCHGMLGLDAALGRACDVPAAAALREELRGVLTADALRARLADPMVRYNQSPALMTGRAGVLWHLLDRVAPGRLPSPLALDRGLPPAGCGRPDPAVAVGHQPEPVR